MTIALVGLSLILVRLVLRPKLLGTFIAVASNGILLVGRPFNAVLA